MRRLFARPWTRLVLGRRARVDAFATLADLAAAGFELEAALAVLADGAAGQRQHARARLFAAWRRDLLSGRFQSRLADTLPAAESTVFAAYGRIEPARLFAAAARVARLRERQVRAIAQALAPPVGLVLFSLALLWLAAGHFIPEMERLVPPEHWPGAAGAVRAAASFLYDHTTAVLVSGVLGLGILLRLLHAWRGAGRTLADRMAPFSLARTLAGSAFFFTALEFLAAGLDLNDRTFEDLKRHASPYARHRIGTIQAHMARGAGFGRAMTLAGHGFPDPALIPIVAALDGVADGADRLARFAERWTERADSLRARAAGLATGLFGLVALATGVAIDALFTLMTLAGAVPAAP